MQVDEKKKQMRNVISNQMQRMLTRQKGQRGIDAMGAGDRHSSLTAASTLVATRDINSFAQQVQNQHADKARAKSYNGPMKRRQGPNAPTHSADYEEASKGAQKTVAASNAAVDGQREATRSLSQPPSSTPNPSAQIPSGPKKAGGIGSIQGSTPKRVAPP